MNEKQHQLDNLRKERDGYVNKMTWFALSLIAIFGVPAGIALFLGKVVWQSSLVLGVSLFVAFVLSWLIVIYRYKNISKRVYDIEDSIKEIVSQLEAEISE